MRIDFFPIPLTQEDFLIVQKAQKEVCPAATR
jgi:hypothetical protein